MIATCHALDAQGSKGEDHRPDVDRLFVWPWRIAHRATRELPRGIVALAVVSVHKIPRCLQPVAHVDRAAEHVRVDPTTSWTSCDAYAHLRCGVQRSVMACRVAATSRSMIR